MNAVGADVAIVGAGPAGTAAALALAGAAVPGTRVALIDRRAVPADRIGETLPGAARRLLAGLDLDADDVLADGHAPVWARRSVWGAPDPAERDALADPDGPARRLDRRRFEARLRAEAVARGATLVAPALARTAHGAPGATATATPADRGARNWAIEAGTVRVEATLLIDATGRGSRLLRDVAGRALPDDRLVCVWTHLPLRRTAQAVTYTESERDGWWYSAPLPDGRRVLAFHTDADLVRATGVRTALVARALTLPALAAEIADADADAAGPVRACAAHGARRGAAAGPHWFAAGDAGMCFDPLSSQGLFHALYTGLHAGRAAAALLRGDATAGATYAAGLDAVWDAYRAHRADWYGLERRWADAPFWRRRLGG